MAFDLHISIPDNSPAGLAVQRLVSDEHMTPEQAVARILNEADMPDENAQTTRRRRPNLEVAKTMPIFGMFAGKPEFSKAMDVVLASREERYFRFTA